MVIKITKETDKETYKEGQQRRFNKWYDKNKKALAKKRKDRYDNDPEYRELCKTRSRQYKGEITRPGKGWTYRKVQGRRVLVCTFGCLLGMLGVSSFLFCSKEKKHEFPKASTPGVQRVYTKPQVKLLVAYFAALEAGEGIEEASAEAKVKWRRRT